jgi:hypothetical protein
MPVVTSRAVVGASRGAKHYKVFPRSSVGAIAPHPSRLEVRSRVRTAAGLTGC